jgi:hypothetical protein
MSSTAKHSTDDCVWACADFIINEKGDKNMIFFYSYFQKDSDMT